MLRRLKQSINPSTLSGALDIVVVHHPDGLMRSSPWHVRFGKLGLIHHTNKVISITVNDAPAPFLMYVDNAGKGQFFAAQSPKPSKSAVSYPSRQTQSVAVTPKDIRNILASKPAPNVRPQADFQGKYILRDTAVDLDAALRFEDPDPLPITAVSSSIDLAQSVATASESSDILLEHANDDPVPSSLILESLRPLLHEGRNMLTFTVSSLIQGPRTVIALLYLWSSTTKIVISDVDGTVTSSDVLGHVLPPMNRDWTHPGLTHLYNRVASKGIRFLYLSSRPIGEAPVTRNMLQKIQQDGVSLPDGPIITCPDRLLKSLTREIKRMPHEFKIPTLDAISKLFGDRNPYVFGFGNRKTDVISYIGVGLKPEQILLFNTAHKVLDASSKELYKSISDLTPEIERILQESGALD